MELGFHWLSETVFAGDTSVVFVSPVKAIAVRALRSISGGDDPVEYQKNQLERAQGEWGIYPGDQRRFFIAIPSTERGHW